MRVVSKKFSIASPIQTHTRPATCQEAECEYYQKGWKTRVETLNPKSVEYIKHSGRHYAEERVADGETYFVFPPGQQCFTQHRVNLDRPEFYIVRGPGGTRKHDKPEHWVEEHSEDLDKLRKKIEE